MGDNIKYCCGCIIVIFLIFGVFSMINNIHWTSDNLSAEDIHISRFDSGVTLYPSNHDDYLYHVFYDLKNVSSSFEDSKLITYFYAGDKIAMSNEVYHLSNNTTKTISYDDLKDYNHLSCSAFLHSDNLTNITHVVIVMIKDGKVIFNTTEPFNMSNFEVFQSSNHENTSLNKSDSSSSSTAHTYVASSNSNKFHDPSCSQAGRIKDYNKITFSSRDDAINSGYSPCGICHP